MEIPINIKHFFQKILVRILKFYVNLKKLFTFKINWSFYSLLAVNVIIATFALIKHFDFPTLLLIYWVQSVIIGLLHFIRILSLKNFSIENFKIVRKNYEPKATTRNYTAFLFLLLYGLSHLAYLVFLSSKLNPDSPFVLFVVLSIGFLLANHLFSFIKNFKKDVERKPTIGRILFFPYARVIPMQLIVFLGFFLEDKGLFFFILFKLIADLLMHDVEHKDEESKIVWREKKVENQITYDYLKDARV